MAIKHYDWNDLPEIEEHSKRKHKIIREYFKKYLFERCKIPHARRFRLAIVDGFAGGGRYKMGKPGSPLIFAKTLLETVDKINIMRDAQNMPNIEIECLLILNDNSPSAIEKLKENIAPYIAQSKEPGSKVHFDVRFFQEDFQEHLEKFKLIIQAERYNNVIYNLDQYGYKNVSTSIISELMNSNTSVEVFLTFTIKAFVTYLKANDIEALKKSFEPLGIDFKENIISEIPQTKRQWLGAVEKLVFEHFHKSAPYVSPFAINGQKKWGYWFMHFANNYRARQVYNDILHNNNSDQAHFGRSGLKMLSYKPDPEHGSLYLFDPNGRNEAKEQLLEDIPRLISKGGDATSVLEFYSNIYNDTPAHSNDIHSALIDNRDVEVLTPKGQPRRSINTIRKNDIIRLKPQLYLDLFTKKTSGPV